jgi:LysM repeat protein
MVAIVVGLVIAAYAAISLTAGGGVFSRGGSTALEDKLPAEVMKIAETIPAKTAETLDALPAIPARAVRAVESLPSVLPPAPAPIRRSLDRLDARLRPRAKATSPAATRASVRSGGGVSLSPARCSALSADEALLTLHVYQGMTLSDLALHFSTTVEGIRGVNPGLRNGMLVAGNAYRVPLDHLRVLRHKVRAGDTLSQLARDLDAPSAYSIRTWNCLPSNKLLAGKQLLLFRSRLDGQLARGSF